MRKLGVNCQLGSNYTKCLLNSFRTCKYSYHLDELADIALQSESDSVRDECSSGIRSEAEDEAAVTSDSRPPRPSARSKPGLGQAPAHLSLSTTSSLSSCSNPSQARLVQSSLRDIRDSSGPPPAPPPRTSSATSGSGDNGAGSVSSGQELGKPASGGGSKTTCMQCYLSGHSDGSLDSSVDHPSVGSTEGSSASGLTLSVGQRSEDNGGRDRDSGIVELGDKFDRCFEPTGEDGGQQSDEKTKDNN